MAKFATNASGPSGGPTNVSGAMLLPSSIQVTESISGSVVPLAMFNIYADVDAISLTPSRNTRSYTLRSVPSSPGRSFLQGSL